MGDHVCDLPFTVGKWICPDCGQGYVITSDPAGIHWASSRIKPGLEGTPDTVKFKGNA